MIETFSINQNIFQKKIVVKYLTSLTDMLKSQSSRAGGKMVELQAIFARLPTTAATTRTTVIATANDC